MKDHLTRVDLSSNEHHPLIWEAICGCGWHVAFGSRKPRRKVWRTANRWATHHESLNTRETVQ